MTEKQKLKKFIEEYKKLSKKYGYDFVAQIKFDKNEIRPVIRFIKNKDKKL